MRPEPPFFISKKWSFELYILDEKIQINLTIYQKILKFCKKKKKNKINVKFLMEDASSHQSLFL